MDYHLAFHSTPYVVSVLNYESDSLDFGHKLGPRQIEIGYMLEGYWTLLDNYEWTSYKPTFGMASVDRENGFRRTIKPSGYFYRDIIKANGLRQDIPQKYLTEMPRCVYKD